MCQYLVLNAEQKHIYMKILHRKDAYKSESMQLDVNVNEYLSQVGTNI